MQSALIVDQDSASQDRLTRVLRGAFADIQIACAGAMSEAMAQAAEQSFSLLLVDTRLPDAPCEDVVHRMLLCRPDTYVVIVTDPQADHQMLPLLRAGAHGYLLKDETCAELGRLLEGTARGEPPLSPRIMLRILDHFRSGLDTAREVRALSSRETTVVSMLARGFNRGDIANALDISTSTVATYTRNIYRKLGVSNRAEAAFRAARLGLVPPRDGQGMLHAEPRAGHARKGAH